MGERTMVRTGFLGLKRWKPDLTRESPPKREWPTYIEPLDIRTFHDFIAKYPVSLIDFYSPACKPCKAISPQIRLLSKCYKYRIAFGKVNVFDNREIAEEYHIMSVPYLFIFSYGEKVKSLLGKNLVAEIDVALQEILAEFEKKHS